MIKNHIHILFSFYCFKNLRWVNINYHIYIYQFVLHKNNYSPDNNYQTKLQKKTIKQYKMCFDKKKSLKKVVSFGGNGYSYIPFLTSGNS